LIQLFTFYFFFLCGLWGKFLVFVGRAWDGESGFLQNVLASLFLYCWKKLFSGFFLFACLIADDILMRFDFFSFFLL